MFQRILETFQIFMKAHGSYRILEKFLEFSIILQSYNFWNVVIFSNFLENSENFSLLQRTAKTNSIYNELQYTSIFCKAKMATILMI